MSWYEGILNHLSLKGFSKRFVEISGKLSPLEIAWLINHAEGLTVTQKHNAFKKLMNEIPDCEVPKEISGIYHPSLYELLKEYIVIENRAITDFMLPEEGRIYLANVKETEWEWTEIGTAFNDLKACLNLAESTFKYYEEIHVDKVYLNIAVSHPLAIFNSQNEIMGIYGFEMNDEEREIITFLNDEKISDMFVED